MCSAGQVCEYPPKLLFFMHEILFFRTKRQVVNRKQQFLRVFKKLCHLNIWALSPWYLYANSARKRNSFLNERCPTDNHKIKIIPYFGNSLYTTLCIRLRTLLRISKRLFTSGYTRLERKI